MKRLSLFIVLLVMAVSTLGCKPVVQQAPDVVVDTPADPIPAEDPAVEPADPVAVPSVQLDEPPAVTPEPTNAQRPTVPDISLDPAVKTEDKKPADEPKPAAEKKDDVKEETKPEPAVEKKEDVKEEKDA